jgi:hypothetical protein
MECVSEGTSAERYLPASTRAPCLGCGGRIVTARDPYVQIAGRRDGSVLLLIDAKPLIALATDSGRLFEPGLELLGVAHRDCARRARQRLEAQQVELPEEQPLLVVDEEVGDLPALHLPPTSSFCAFCGAAHITDEHVWPKWISRQLQDDGGFLMPSPYGPRRMRSLEITAPVCETCNNRWLSVLENDVRLVLGPLVRGEERTLSTGEQQLLATWAVKTALMLDLSGGVPLVPTGFYVDFRQRRQPLRGQAVWLGAYRGSHWAMWAQQRGLRVGISADELPNAFVTTFTAFRIVFQVFGHFTTGGATIDDGRQSAAALERIWPPRGRPIDWPPRGLAFSDGSLIELAQSIRG